ncbi:hypothetical protein BAY1663_00617 [Pseudomonas sp. BAY1663]|nr:hypothetical protein BAY1663_00617 [Pseudomonas sp. BAY1663]
MVFARGDQRLFADDPGAAHFLHLAIAIGDDPVPRKQLRRNLASVFDGYRVGKGVAVLFRLRLCGQVAGRDADIDAIALIFGH